MNFSPKVNLEGFFCALTFNCGHVTCDETKIENEGNWWIGSEFTLFDKQIGISETG